MTIHTDAIRLLTHEAILRTICAIANDEPPICTTHVATGETRRLTPAQSARFLDNRNPADWVLA